MENVDDILKREATYTVGDLRKLIENLEGCIIEKIKSVVVGLKTERTRLFCVVVRKRLRK